MLTNVEVSKLIEETGHGSLPSGCCFIPLNRGITEEVVIAPASPMPKIYYLKQNSEGKLIGFKAM